MNELLSELIGWLGYLQRGSVLLQIAVIVAVRLLLRSRLARRCLPACPPPLRALLGALLCLLISLGMTAAGWPAGLLQTLTLYWLALILLALLELQLPRWIPEAQVYALMSRLLRPACLVLLAIQLINQLDSLQDVAVIAMGKVFGVEISLGKVFGSLLILYFLVVGSGPPSALTAWLLQNVLGINDSSGKAMSLIFRYALVGIGIAAVCFHLGFSPTALVAITGGLSVGLGFGIKEVCSNFISGIWLLFEGSVRPGEVLMIDGDPCEVRRLGLRATLLWRGRDNAELLIPNQSFFTNAATTYTATDRMRRSQVSVGAAYRHDPADVIALLEAAALTVPRVLPTPAPRALMLSYGDSAIQYVLRFWIANPMHNVSICSEVNQAIWSTFQREGIEIPYPQQVQHIARGTPRGDAPSPR